MMRAVTKGDHFVVGQVMGVEGVQDSDRELVVVEVLGGLSILRSTSPPS